MSEPEYPWIVIVTATGGYTGVCLSPYSSHELTSAEQVRIAKRLFPAYHKPRGTSWETYVMDYCNFEAAPMRYTYCVPKRRAKKVKG